MSSTRRSSRRAPAAPRSPARRNAGRPPTGFAAALLIVVGVLVYANGLSAPFIWDDETAILKNQTIRQLTPLSGPLSPPPETPVAGRPLANLSLAFNYAIGEIAPRGYRIWNLGVVIGCALLLFGIMRRVLLMGGPTASRPHVSPASGSLALFAALWWLVHPLLSETVGYVTQRTESMMGGFLLLTLYAAIRAAETGAARWWVPVSVAACFAGMATKESMVVAPVVVLLYDVLVAEGAWLDRLRSRAGLYAGLAASWALLALLVANAQRTTAGFGTSVSSWRYAANQLEAVARYASLVVWPRQLVLDYGLPRSVEFGEMAGPTAVVLVLLAGTAAALIRVPRYGFALACVWLTLAPTSSVLPIASEVAAERRMFLPLAALAPCVAVGGWWLTERASRISSWARPLAAALGVIWLAGLAAMTVARNTEYRDVLTLWKTSVERRPHGRARLSYAIELIAAGRQDDAITQLRQAVVDYPRARYALGTELAIKGDIDGAVEQLLGFLKDGPSGPSRIPAHRLLGRLFVSKGQPEASIEQFKALVALSPTDADAHASLGDLYAALGRLKEAEAEYRTLVAGRPQNPDGYLRLGLVLIGSGQLEQAVVALERATQLNPDLPDPQLRLAEVLVQLQQPDRAIDHANRALAVAPSDAAHNVAGAALAQQGRLEEAITHFRAALELAPANERARQNLERAERIASRPRP